MSPGRKATSAHIILLLTRVSRFNTREQPKKNWKKAAKKKKQEANDEHVRRASTTNNILSLATTGVVCHCTQAQFLRKRQRQSLHDQLAATLARFFGHLYVNFINSKMMQFFPYVKFLAERKATQLRAGLLSWRNFTSCELRGDYHHYRHPRSGIARWHVAQ